MLLFLATLAAQAAPTAGELQQAWRTVAATHAQHGQVPVELDPSDFESLARGEVVKRMLSTGEQVAAQGVVWSPSSADELWVTIQDPEHRNIGNQDFAVTRLPESTPQRRLSYQYVTTPWPLANRQQIFAAVNNQAVYDASGGKVWERYVELQEPSPSVSKDPEAVWIEHLAGGFVLVDLAEGSLVVMRIETDPGGHVPADLATRVSLMSMGGTLRRLVEYAEEIGQHYDAGHPPSLRPNGSVIAPGTLAP